jgi:FHA domain-containing protein
MNRAQLTFAELLGLARASAPDEFETRIDCPYLIATGTLAGDVRPGRVLGETSSLQLDDGRAAHTMAKKHPLAGQVFAVRKRLRSDPARVHLGRTEENDIVIDETSVSSHQASFERNGELLFLSDAGSRNGTYVNLDRIDKGESKPVKDEDVVTFGRVSFQFFNPLPLYYALKAFTEGAV